MAKFCTKCGKKLMDGEVCDCTRSQAADPQDKTVVLNTENVQNTQRAAGSPEENYEQRMRQQQAAQGQPYQNGPQNQQWQNGPQNQQWQNGPQGQPYQNGPQNQQWQNGPQGQPYQNGPQNQQWQNGPQGQQWQNGPQGQQWQNGPQGQQWQNGPQGQQWQNSPQSQWFSEKKDQIVKNAKNLFAQLGPLLKKPDTTLKELGKSNNSLISLEMIGLHAVMVLIMILVLGSKFSIPKEMREWTDTSSLFPTFQMILINILMIVGVAYLQAFLLKAFSKKMYQEPTLNQTLLVSGVSSLVKFFGAAVNMLLILIFVPSIKGMASSAFGSASSASGLMWGLGLILLVQALVSLVTMVFEFKAYQCVVNGDEDKKVWTFILTKVVLGLIVALIYWLMMKSLGAGLMDALESLF